MPKKKEPKPNYVEDISIKQVMNGGVAGGGLGLGGQLGVADVNLAATAKLPENSDYFKVKKLQVGEGTQVFKADKNGIFLGASSFASAPFRVTMAGALTATSATISGSITATSGAIGGFDIAANTLSAGTTNIILDSSNKAISINAATFGNAGIQLQYNSGTPRAYIGDGSNAYFQFDGTKIQWKATNSELDASGNLTATSATISGSITATAGAIGGWDIITGYIYSLASGTPTASPSDGLVLASGNEGITVYENTEKRVEVGYLSAGVYGIKGYDDDGSTVMFELSDTQKLISGVPITNIASGTEIAIQGWQQDMTFSSSNYRTVAWASGTITLLDGTTYSITGANTGNMSALTYIYLDIATSTTALQVTTTAATAVGTGKILIAVAENNSDTSSNATFQVFGGKGGTLLTVDNIAANSASTNEFVSNTAQIKDAIITNAKIDTLAVDKLTAGTMTSKTFTLAVAAGTGDSFFNAGKTDFGQDATGGFILGIDDSDDDKAKFEIGSSATKVLKYDGTDLSMIGGTITGGTIQTATSGQRIVLNSDGTMYFYKTGSTWSLALGTDFTNLIQTIQTQSDENKQCLVLSNLGTGARSIGSLEVFNSNASNPDPCARFQTSGTGCHLRLPARSVTPTAASLVGDIALVTDHLEVCTSAGTPGTWVEVIQGAQSDYTDLTDSGATTLHYHLTFKRGTFGRNTSNGTGTFNIAHGLGKVPKKVTLKCVASPATGILGVSIGSAVSTTDEGCIYWGWQQSNNQNVAAQDTINIMQLDPGGTGSGTSVIGNVTVLDSTNITINWTTVNNGGADFDVWMTWEAEG